MAENEFNLVHSKAVSKPLCNHSEYYEYHVLQWNYHNLALADMTVSDGVSPSPKGGGKFKSIFQSYYETVSANLCSDLCMLRCRNSYAMPNSAHARARNSNSLTASILQSSVNQ